MRTFPPVVVVLQGASISSPTSMPCLAAMDFLCTVLIMHFPQCLKCVRFIQISPFSDMMNRWSEYVFWGGQDP